MSGPVSGPPMPTVRAGNPTDGEPPLGDQHVTYDVAELAEELGAVVEAAFPDDIWIRGQIRNLNRRSRQGHVYFDLVTPGPADKSPQAALPVVLFDWYRQIVNRILGTGASGQMTDGVEIRIRAGVSFYKARGRLQLQMKTIDPEYTLSRLADERDRLLGELAAAGLLERNRALPMPTVPLRVGLVTSAGSAAEADFRDVLTAGGMGWEILMVDTPVQGFGSEQRIAAALDLADRRGVDVIALVRGGGARTELAPFDSAAVVHAVVTRSVPVLTGIGHEIDRSLADVVAHTACNTPTAAATFLLERVRAFDRQVLALWRGIERAAVGGLADDRRQLDRTRRRAGAAVSTVCGSARAGVHRLALDVAKAAHRGTERAGSHLDHQQTRVVERAAARLGRHRQTLAVAADRLRGDTTQTLAAEGRRLDNVAAQVHAYDPQRALERGWSMTSDAAGRLIRSVGEVVPGATLRTRMRDGVIESTVRAVSPNDTTGSPGNDD